MYQAFDRVTKAAVVTVPEQTEGDIFCKLEEIYKSRLAQSARGQAILRTGKEIARGLLLTSFEVKYAVGVWLEGKDCKFLPEQEEIVAFYLKKNKRVDVPISGVYDPSSGLFLADHNDNEYELDQIRAFIILPPYDPVSA